MNILDKILALKKLSENKSATPAEAASAAARMQELMTKHQIEEASLGVAEEGVEWDRNPIYSSKQASKWRVGLASGLSNINGCRVLRGKALDGTVRMSLAGRKSDVEVVRHMFLFLEREIESLGKKYVKTMPKYGVISAKVLGQSYRFGCVNKVVERLTEQKRTVTEQASADGLTSALVVLDQRNVAIEAWLQKHAPNKHVHASVQLDAMAYHAGQRDGALIPIRRAIEVQSA